MTEAEKKAVEEAEAAKKAADAKAAEDAAAAAAAEDDNAVIETLGKSFEEIQRIQKERDNYREGMLKAKGKKPEDETDDERIERIVNEKIASSQLGQAVEQFKQQLTKVVSENKELRAANRSKASIQSKSGGGNQDPGRDTKVDPLANVPADLRSRLANISDKRREQLLTRWRAMGIIK